MNTTVNSITWGDVRLGSEEWHQIDDLWISIAAGSGETDISYCYATPGARWLQFSATREVRIPVDAALTVAQKLSTRPVLARPYKPLTIPSRKRLRLFVGTPLWLTIMADDDALLDIPVSRISDSWFGADTMNGEICYDCRTKARLSMDDIPRNPFKAITPVDIHNDSDKPVTIDRINLPINHMSMFDGGDRHWTSMIELSVSNISRVIIGEGPPEECKGGDLIAEAREPLESGFLNKTMDLLLG